MTQLQLFNQPLAWPHYGDPRCRDCRVDVIEAGEYFGVHNHVWPLEPRGGMLCIGCLEQRIGRTLTPDDFPDAAANRFPGQSRRLANRLGREGA